MDDVRYREVQRFRQWWFVALVVATAAIGWVAWVQQVVLGEPFGSKPASDAAVWALWIGTGLLVPAAALWLRLVTEVRDGRVSVRFPPFRPREIGTDEILDVRAVSIRPVTEWGGYGYRRNLQGEVAFLVRGTDAVRLSLGEREAVVIGTRRPERLETAIREAAQPASR